MARLLTSVLSFETGILKPSNFLKVYIHSLDKVSYPIFTGHKMFAEIVRSIEETVSGRTSKTRRTSKQE